MKKEKLYVLGAMFLALLLNTKIMAQEKKHMYRIAKIHVDPSQIDKYNAALKEQMTTAIRVEPGVLSYYAVADKKDASKIIIFEIYADSAAYRAHLLAPHFKKYKETVEQMVTSLEIINVDLIGSAKKQGN